MTKMLPMPPDIYIIDSLGNEVPCDIGEYLAMWGCDPAYDRAPRHRGDGYIFYNYPCEHDSQYRSQLIAAIIRQLLDITMEEIDRDNFEKLLAYFSAF
jgi:hypothetical protein